MTFQELKTKIVDLCKKHGACQEEFKRILSSESEKEILQVLKDNMTWCVVSSKILTGNDLKEWFGSDLCAELDIYFEGHHEFTQGHSIHFNSSTSKHYGSSTSEHYDSSTSKHYGSSTSKHYDSSASEHYGSSASEHYDSSTSKHYGSSTSEHYHSSTSKHYGSSTSKHYDSSTCYSTSERELNDSAIRRDVNSNKIYLRKGASEIVYV